MDAGVDAVRAGWDDVGVEAGFGHGVDVAAQVGGGVEVGGERSVPVGGVWAFDRVLGQLLADAVLAVGAPGGP